MAGKTKSGMRKPLLKWPGGKERELKHLLPCMPGRYARYIEPFVGGGSVFLNVEAPLYAVNDLSVELMNLYDCVKGSNPDFFESLSHIHDMWLRIEPGEEVCSGVSKIYRQYAEDNDPERMTASVSEILNHIDTVHFKWETSALQLSQIATSLTKKLVRTAAIEREKGVLPTSDLNDNIVAAFKGSLYTWLRREYNIGREKANGVKQTALFLFLRTYAFSGMFRYDAGGNFNVPYGGIGYNHHTLADKIAYYKSDDLRRRLENAELYNLDFEEFLGAVSPEADDFIFLDPPYDTDFSTYAGNSFDATAHRRLADYLLGNCPAKWLLVIKRTPLIEQLYCSPRLNIREFDKTYQVSFKNRNHRQSKHLLITNY